MVAVEAEARIVVGIDFGTTYSGSAWARSGKAENITIITNWRSRLRGNFDSHKAPTQIHFGNGTAGPQVTWGYNVPIDETPLKWFKLLLIEERDIPENLRQSDQLANARQLLKRSGKSVGDVISAYLKAFWEHITSRIKRSTGEMLWSLSVLDVVITLPAIWPHYAQARMRRAAQAAGILDERDVGQTTLKFISEPEAAAIATLNDMTNRPDIKVGDHLIVCDAGGGTVDIITYEVMRNEPLSMRESIQGDGKLCGAIFVDENFVRLVKSRIGETEWDSFSPKTIKKFLNDNWEHDIKKEFDNSGENEWMTWTVQMPSEGASMSGFQDNELQFTQPEMLSVFEPIAAEVEALVVDQAKKVRLKYSVAPKYIILVGGFGRCQYLYTKLRSSPSIAAVSDNIDVLQGSGDRPWTAICRGAVLRGLTLNTESPSAVSISSRVSRASYGVKASIPYKEGVHEANEKRWHRDELMWKTDTVAWFLEIGDDVSETNPVRHEFYNLYEVWETKVTASSILSFSRAPIPPSKPDKSVKQLCEISWQDTLDLSKFPLWYNMERVAYRRVVYTMEMICDGASVDFVIYIGGKMVAKQNVGVMFE